MYLIQFTLILFFRFLFLFLSPQTHVDNEQQLTVMSSNRNYSNAYLASSNAVLGADINRGIFYSFVKNQGCGHYQRKNIIRGDTVYDLKQTWMEQKCNKDIALHNFFDNFKFNHSYSVRNRLKFLLCPNKLVVMQRCKCQMQTCQQRLWCMKCCPPLSLMLQLDGYEIWMAVFSKLPSNLQNSSKMLNDYIFTLYNNRQIT